MFEMLTNTCNWDVDNVLSLISISLVVISSFFAFSQWRSSNKIKRTEFINQIIEKLRFDEKIVSTMYKIEYDYSWYNDNFHNNNENLEYEVDKLFSYLSYICYIYQLKVISKKEFKILRYNLNRVCVSPSVQSYLWNLYHFAKSQNSESTFQYLIEYGISNKLINKHIFYDNKTKSYPKYLNF